jgi:hypothetical protein
MIIFDTLDISQLSHNGASVGFDVTFFSAGPEIGWLRAPFAESFEMVRVVLKRPFPTFPSHVVVIFIFSEYH